jgi:hypothetical protein
MTDTRAVARMHLTQMQKCQRRGEIAAARAMLATFRCAWTTAAEEHQRAENWSERAAKHRDALWAYLTDPTETTL